MDVTVDPGLVDGTHMLRIAAGLFVIAALGGLVMAGIRLAAHRNPPIWLAYAHGLLAAAGLSLLVYAALATPLTTPVMGAVWLLLAAAAGGSALNLLYHWRQRPLPKGLMLAHGALAAAGLAMLLVAIY
jgi:hypothetical protein